jgi:hypothetical protein
MWIPSHVGISGNKVADGLARQAVESGTVHEQKTVANDHRILARRAMVKQWQHCWQIGNTDLWSQSNHGLMGRRRIFATTISRVMSGHLNRRGPNLCMYDEL